ncbi:hypothetical protein [Leptolyngbya ohadii]|nr:hypothetical protein [Leptolyngbya ohadii]
MAMDDRKKRIMEHLARSSGNFIQQSTPRNSEQRKQQILDHVKRTKG